MENLEIYNQVRKVPSEAKRKIKGGRLSGKTDVNPMWRLKTLTEVFGPCGFGWAYEVTNRHMERGAGDEVAAFVDILLRVKRDGEWSDPIPGTGGSMFVEKEQRGLHTSDECYKMALTDAISVACKALGVAADVYWEKDPTKYGDPAEGKQKTGAAPICPACGNAVKPQNWEGEAVPPQEVLEACEGICYDCYCDRTEDEHA